jgi:hypothetical protein
VLKIIACIEDPQVIAKILEHLHLSAAPAFKPAARAPPANWLNRERGSGRGQ